MLHLILLSTLALAADPAPVSTPDAAAPTTEVAAPAETPTAPADGTTPAPAAPADATATVTAAPVATPEITVPATTEQAVEQGTEAFSAFQAGSWGLGIVLVIGLLIFGYNKFFAKKAA